MTPTIQPTPFNTLEEIQLRKQQLQADIQQQNKKISMLWHELTTRHPPSTKGEMIAGLVSHSVTAIDGFLTLRKLMKTYGWLFNFRKRKK